jgi:hypothetical protein
MLDSRRMGSEFASQWEQIGGDVAVLLEGLFSGRDLTAKKEKPLRGPVGIRDRRV